MPSQRHAESVTPSLPHWSGEAPLHTVPAGQKAQAPALHWPVVPHLLEGLTAHWPWGSLPDGTGTHMPAILPALQKVQAPVQSLLQQTPSAQWPLTHSPALLQDVPSTFLQAPPTHCSLAPQAWRQLLQ